MILIYTFIIAVCLSCGQAGILSQSDTLTTATVSNGVALGSGGGTLTLTSTNFSPDSNSVTIGGASCAILTQSSTTITCTIPANPNGTSAISKVDVVITDDDGKSITVTEGVTYLGAPYVWFDPSDSTSITTDGSDGVSQANDLSGNSRNAVQSTVLERMTLVSNAINGRSAFYNDNNTKRLIIGTNTDFTFMHDGSAYFLAVALHPTLGTQFSGVMGTSRGSATDVGFYIGFDNRGALNMQTSHGIANGTGTLYIDAQSGTTNSGVNNNNVVLSAYFDGGSTRTYLDNSQVDTQATSGAASGANSTYDFQLGGNSNNNFNFFGYIGEVLIYDEALSSNERSILDDYLGSKWRGN